MNQLHTIPPLYNAGSRTLILGSFPSVKSHEQGFFYGHPQNRFWQVLAGVFGCEIPGTIEEKKALLLSHSVALWDVIASCEITGSSDSSIKNATPNDLRGILEDCDIHAIFVNGKTAERLYIKHIQPQIQRPTVRLPSTSPANAAWSLPRLIAEWERIKN